MPYSKKIKNKKYSDGLSKIVVNISIKLTTSHRNLAIEINQQKIYSPGNGD